MSEKEKSSCILMDDCIVSFSSETILNGSKKKNSFKLNIANTKSNDLVVVDQTPTPTRFIRNCEEVGLFQDLQNVNPFDEMFKKAAESPKNALLSVPVTIHNDDTLHTPHILPQDVESQDKDCFSGGNNNRTISDSDSDSLVIKIDDDDDEEDYKIDQQNVSGLQLLKYNNKSNLNSKNSNKVNLKITADKKASIINKDNEKIERIREMNRAAQIRCRRKRQIKIDRMKNEFNQLQVESKRLRLENLHLNEENVKLKLENAHLKKTNDHLKDLLNKLKNLLNNDLILKDEIKDNKIVENTAPIMIAVPVNTLDVVKDSFSITEDRKRPLILRKILPKQI